MINYLFKAIGYEYKRNDAAVFDVLDEILLIDKMTKNHYVTLYALYSNLGATEELLVEWRKANNCHVLKESTQNYPAAATIDLLCWGLVTKIKYIGTKSKDDSLFGVTAKGQRILTLIEATMKQTNGSYTPPTVPTVPLAILHPELKNLTYSCSKTLLKELTKKRSAEYELLTCDIAPDGLEAAFKILDSFGITNGMYQVMFSLYHSLDIDLVDVKLKTIKDLETLGCFKNKEQISEGVSIFTKVLQLKEFFDKVQFTENKLLENPKELLSKLIMNGVLPANTSKKYLYNFYPYAIQEGYIDSVNKKLTLAGMVLQKNVNDLDVNRNVSTSTGLKESDFTLGSVSQAMMFSHRV